VKEHRKPHYSNFWKVYGMNFVQLLILGVVVDFLIWRERRIDKFSREYQYAMTAYWFPAHWLGR